METVVGGVLFDEEVRDVLADETEECCQVHDLERDVFEDGCVVEDFAGACWADARFDDYAGYCQSDDGDESDDSNSPAKTETGGLDVGEDEGVDYAA